MMNSDTMQSVAIPMLGLVLATVFPAFLISVFAVGLVKRFAVTLGLLDEPNARKVHTVPIPLGGGLGIWLESRAEFRESRGGGRRLENEYAAFVQDTFPAVSF